MGPLTLGLLTEYKICPGLAFSSAVLGVVEKKSYKFFYLFFEVALTSVFESMKKKI
jgi:hypothetical protein